MIRLNRFKISVWLVSMFVFLSFLRTGSCYQNWTVLKDDDGSCDSYWGMCGPGQAAGKLFTVNVNPSQIGSAIIRYEMGSNPYNAKAKGAYDKPVEGVDWAADVVIKVNDMIVARGSPLELATKGWHKIQFDPDVLDEGDNLVVITWTEGVKDKGEGYFYLGIDTHTNHQRSGCLIGDRPVILDFKSLRPGMDPDPKWQGEYMIRLMIALQGA